MKTNYWHSLVVAGMAIGTALTATQVAAQDSASPAPATTASSGSAVLPFGAAQILQLVQAKVSEDTVIAFIRNSGNSYGLKADQIIYLRQQGVTDAVLTAMLSQPRNGLVSAPPAPPAPPAPAPAPVAEAPAASTATVAPTVTYVQPAPATTYYYADPYYYDPYYYYYPAYGWYAPVSVGWSWGWGWHGGYHGYYGGGWHGGGGHIGGYGGGHGGVGGGGHGGGHR